MSKPIVRSIHSITPAEKAARIIYRSHLGAAEKNSCRKPVWVTCFFDGTGNNYLKDGAGRNDEEVVKYSNISKLWHFAHPLDDDTNRVHGLYIQGVGTPCPQVGDSGDGIDKATGMSTANKGALRIDWIMRELKGRIDRHMPAVNQINVAVFGFSRGAAQARAFVRMLGEACLRQGSDLIWTKSGGGPHYPRVVVYFLGIFDTVASVGFGGSRLENTIKRSAFATYPLTGPIGPILGGVLHAVDGGGHAEWASDLRIPEYVLFCEHFIAAHEVREKFPSDSVREDVAFPQNCRETLYPGAHSDVGGGYESLEQDGRSNALSRIPLCNMYISAYAAGVPFFDPDKVRRQAGTLFDVSDELRKCFNVYMRTVANAQRLESQCISHMNSYYHWRWGRTQRQRDSEKERRALVANGKSVISAIPDRYMAITDDEWQADVADVAAKRTGYIRRSTGAHEDAIFSAWKGTLRKSLSVEDRRLFDLFFDRYVHDSIAGFKNQMDDSSISFAERSRWTRNRQYFLGKRGSKFIYWRYEGSNPAIAPAKVAVLEKREDFTGDQAVG